MIWNSNPAALGVTQDVWVRRSSAGAAQGASDTVNTPPVFCLATSKPKHKARILSNTRTPP